jgi:phosphotransferase system enzyme I (PtsP)
MFPMVACVDELLVARALLDREWHREAAAGRTMPNRIDVGVMLEVPSLMMALPRLLPHVDFVSVGTNDFVQFLFAADRSHGRVAQRYDPLSPVVLTVLRDLLRQCQEAAVPLALCGEMASNPVDAMALIGLGYRTLSVAPPAVGPIKTMVRSVALAPLRDFVFSLLDRQRTNVRENLRAYARDHGIPI